ncbi:MAG TPA: tRNA pseudouridine(38-40) synthase TruA [Acidimicrobiia bacterium]|nr:tRNA pseudouridine(38-40) synthase TruA [Acidimicrobiia bacterium]
MPTLRVDLAYDGSGFRGYAHQEGLRTVQGTLEGALNTVLEGPVETAVAGRTDAGVHALGQVVSVRVGSRVDGERLARSLNGLLGPEIAVKAVTEVDDDFDARFSARWRRYRYSMSTGPAPDPLSRGFEWHVGPRLDREVMTATATEFVGQHDFSAFCRSMEGRSNVRRVEEAGWEADGDRLHFWIRANAFCHQMVRSLVGLCYDVGRGFTPVESVSEIVESGDRSRVATVAPPHGLTLWEVGY